MISIRKLVGVLCLAFSFSVSNAQIQHYISDDGYSNVPLQFQFPYYGQQFNNSWMFSNGIISFVDPQQSGLAWQNLSVQPFTQNMGSAFNYSIYPLWTDLIDLGGSFTTQGSTEYQRYNWNSISPYADSSRINTFSVELRPSGEIRTQYSAVSINYGVVGYTGNTSRGEFEQLGHYGYTTAVPNWQAVGEASDPCVDNPLVSPQCPGYGEAYTAQQCEIDALYSTQCSGYAAAYQRQQCMISPTYSPQCPGYGAAIVQQVLALPDPVVEVVTEQPAVEETIQQTTSQPSSVVVAATADTQQASQSKPRVAPSTKTLALALAVAIQAVQEADNITQEVQGSETGSSSSESEMSTQGVTLDSILAASTAQVVSNTTTSAPGQRTITKPAEIPGGPDPRALAAQPAGFQDYFSLKLKDAPFYRPTEAYKNQRTVDNQRLLRGLNGGSERLHQSLIELQYK